MRKQISKKVRFEVFKRDSFICQYCGAHPPQEILHVDHINPVANGGDNHIDNLITSCQSCNLGKGARLLTSVTKSLKQKAAEIEEQEKQLLGYQSVLQAKKDRIEQEAWIIADELYPGSSADGIKRDWFSSIKMFIEKIGFHSVMDAAETARTNKPQQNKYRFLYFCGVCWNMVRGNDGTR